MAADAESFDAAPAAGMVTVKVLGADDRLPLGDVAVGFFQPDGAEAVVTSTAADGIASAEVLPGGTIVVFDAVGDAGSIKRARAVFDVQPGDEIVIGGVATFGDPIATMDVTLPSVAGGEVSTPCGSATLNVDYVATISRMERCPLVDFPLLGTAYTSLVLTSSLLAPSVSFQDNGDQNITGTWEPALGHTVSLIGIPSGLSRIIGRTSLGAASDRWLRYRPSIAYVVNSPDTEANLGILRPSQLPPRLDLTITSSSGTTQQQYVWEEDAATTTTVVDLGASLLPWLGRPIYDATPQTVSWPPVASHDGDAFYLLLQMQGDGGNTLWTIVAPPSWDSVTLPPLPDAYAAWIPADLDNILIAGFLRASSAVDGWDQARPLGLEPTLVESLPFEGPGSVVRTSPFDGVPH